MNENLSIVTCTKAGGEVMATAITFGCRTRQPSDKEINFLHDAATKLGIDSVQIVESNHYHIISNPTIAIRIVEFYAEIKKQSFHWTTRRRI